jgi:hypothetical protein
VPQGPLPRASPVAPSPLAGTLEVQPCKAFVVGEHFAALAAVHITVDVDLVEELARVSLLARVLKHLNEPAAFDQRDDLLEADAALANEPGVLLRIEGIVPLFPSIHFMTMCASCQRQSPGVFASDSWGVLLVGPRLPGPACAGPFLMSPRLT